MVAKKEAKVWEFGDFQTPSNLAEIAVNYLRQHLSFVPQTIIEPTCGVGGFLMAAANAFPEAQRIIGLELNRPYIEQLRIKIQDHPYRDKIEIIAGDFFKFDWDQLLESVPKPILVIGNPPWVTNADVGLLRGNNLPEKTNFQNHKGFDAVTGKANFDISEWMLIKHMNWLDVHSGCVAMLCKTAVARKILQQSWKKQILITESRLVQIDAMLHFSAAVDACFFMVKSDQNRKSTDCDYYKSFEEESPSQVIGYHDGLMLSNVTDFTEFHRLNGLDKNYTWRSGVKHDCSKVMELRKEGSSFVNGLGEAVRLENHYVYPLLKSSDLANGRIADARLSVIVTQRRVGEETSGIASLAPMTWKYLNANAALLDKRGSTIYKNKPRFSVFGIGDYAFSEWKVAISGFYKRLNFQIIGPIDRKPVMLDDTGYFLSCSSQEEARFLADMLNSDAAQRFLSSMIFWSDKRPITVDLLKRLHIGKLAQYLGQYDTYEKYAKHRDLLLMQAAE